MSNHAGLLLLLFLPFLHIFSSCSSPATDNVPEARISNDMPGTDSIVVERLIERSIEQYGQGGMHVDITDKYLAEAEEIARTNSNYDQLARINNLLGQRYRNRARYGEAMKFHQKALSFATRVGHNNLLAEVYNQIGVVYRRIDDNPNALKMHVKALRMAEEAGDSVLISSAINSIGNVNYNLDRNITAIEYFKRAMRMSEEMDNKLGLAINYNNMGEALLKLGQVD